MFKFFRLNKFFLFSLLTVLMLWNIETARGHVTIYTLDNPLLESVEQANEQQRLTTAQQVYTQLKSENNPDHAIAQLLLAKQLLKLKQNPEALNHIAQAQAFLITQNRPISLANAYYLEAMTQALSLGKFQSSLAIFIKALELLDKQPPSQQKIQPIATQLSFDISNHLGSLYIFLGQYSNALTYLSKAQQYADLIKSDANSMLLASNFAKLYIKTDNTELAEKNLIESYQLATRLHDIYEVANSLISISRFYRSNNRHQLSIEYALKAVSSSQQSPNGAQLGQSYNNLAISYAESGDDNLALVHYFNVFDALADLPNNLSIALAQHNIGETYVRLKQLNKAQDYLLQANVRFKQADHPLYRLSSNIALASLFADKNQHHVAIEFAIDGLAGAKKLAKADEQLIAHKVLANSYHQVSNTQLALNHHIEIIELLEQKNQQINELIIDLKAADQQMNTVAMKKDIVDLTQSKLTLTRDKQQQQSLNSIFSLIALVIIVLLGVSLLISIRKLKLINKSLNLARCHGLSSLPLLPSPAAINADLKELITDAQYMVLIEIPQFDILKKYLSLEKNQQLQSMWLTDIKTHLSNKIVQLNDSTLITTLNLAQSNSSQSDAEIRKSALDQLVSQLAQTTPGILADTTSLNQNINIGLIKIDDFHGHDFVLSSLSLVELALLALRGSQFLSQQNNSSHWCFLTSTNKSHYPALSQDNRSNWLLAIQQHFLKVECSQDNQITIPWHNFNLKHSF